MEPQMNTDERRCELCARFKLSSERRKNTPHCTAKRGRPRRDPYDPIC